jgi:hypothetical protein
MQVSSLRFGRNDEFVVGVEAWKVSLHHDEAVMNGAPRCCGWSEIFDVVKSRKRRFLHFATLRSK